MRVYACEFADREMSFAPGRQRCNARYKTMRSEEVMIAEILKGAGYGTTGGIVCHYLNG
ncbi:MAG: hypothetical protein M2R45_03723 [Verrucomicrobia subdivision 3 bacterium]|nr:hypothetical protein [Limisphaerales bacterium]MCS1416953.1 hypothetical protein [Limisphaerales bacterium]